jgi:hypothetical protein
VKRGDDRQSDLFRVRRPAPLERAVNDLLIKTAMGVALKESSKSAKAIAAAITKLTGKKLTATALYRLTAPSNDHHISLVRFIAFVRATEAWWLWDAILEADGLAVFEGRDARLAEIGKLERDREALNARIRDLRRDVGAEEPAQ